MNASVTQVHAGFIDAAFKSIFQNVINWINNNPNLPVGAGQNLANNIYNQAFQESQQAISYNYDTCGLPFNQEDCSRLICDVIQGLTYIFIRDAYQTCISGYEQSVTTLYQIRKSSEQIRMYQAPQNNYAIQQRQMGNNYQPVQNNLNTGYMQSNAVIGNPLNNINVDNGNMPASSISRNSQVQPMNQNNHMPPSVNANVAKDLQIINTPVESRLPVVPAPTNLRKLVWVNKIKETVEIGESHSPSATALVFIHHPEVMTKPILIGRETISYLPLYAKDSGELALAIKKCTEYQTLSEIFNALDELSKRHSLTAFLSWFDKRVTNVVQKAFTHRYGINLYIPSYRNDMDDIDAFLLSKGDKVLADVHDLIIRCITDEIANVGYVGDKADENAVIMNTAHSKDCVLVLPWSVRFNPFADDDSKKMIVEGIRYQQFTAMLDDIWQTLNENMISLRIVDCTDMEFIAYRKGNVIHGPSEYAFENTISY